MSHGLIVQFYSDAVEISHRSEKEGRPIFEDMPHVRITIPGDKNNIIERRVDPTDIQKYPVEWAQFKASEKTGIAGTPLQQWPQITRAQVKEAKYFECHTVEQLSELSDAACQRIGNGFSELRNKAKAYLGAADATKEATAQAAENARRDAEMADLRAQIAAMQANAEKDITQSRGPGRPKKETADA